ncbi:MAG: metal-dependent transcriptional regulator [Desulfobacteraceae bacterium]|jgi:DtxR family Mn-dependent transcriptional regulator
MFDTSNKESVVIASSSKVKGVEKPLTPVMEDYLEAIYDLDNEKKVVRVKDIAKRMDVKMPTVTSMLKTLSNRGLVHYEKYEYVELTSSGNDVGREIRRRHSILLAFLTDVLKIDYATANDDACKMEHALSVATMDRLTGFMAFIQECPETEENWLSYFEAYRRHYHKPERCRTSGKTITRKPK